MKKNLFVIVLFFFCHTLRAEYKIFDVILNKTYAIESRSQEVGPEQKFTQKTWIGCAVFNKDAGKGYKVLNDNIFKIFLKYFKESTQQGTMQTDARLRLQTYIDLKSSSQNYNGDYLRNVALTIEDAQCEVKSVVGSQVIYELAIEFKINGSSYNDNERFCIFYYYSGDLNTGKVLPWKPIISEAKKAALQNLIGNRLNEAYLLATHKKVAGEMEENVDSGEEDIYQSNNNQIARTVNIAERINIKEANFYWYKTGLILQVQQFTEGSKIFNGRFFNIFYPYNEAVRIMQLFPEFSYINTLPIVKHHFQNWTEATLQNKLSLLRNEPTIMNFVTDGPRKVKAVNVIRQQVLENGKPISDYQTDYQYDSLQKLLSITYKEQSSIRSKISYQYYPQGNIRTTIKTQPNKDIPDQKITYEYDSQGNLVSKVTNEYARTDYQYYFYNGNTAYLFPFSLFERDVNRYIFKYEINTDRYCSNNACYQLDTKGRIIAIITTPESFEHGQVGRNAAGNISESHFDNDRDNYYFEYDDVGRFKEFSKYDYQTLKKAVNFYYTGNNVYPDRIEIQEKNSNKVLFTEELSWTFFD